MITRAEKIADHHRKIAIVRAKHAATIAALNAKWNYTHTFHDSHVMAWGDYLAGLAS